MKNTGNKGRGARTSGALRIGLSTKDGLPPPCNDPDLIKRVSAIKSHSKVAIEAAKTASRDKSTDWRLLADGRAK